LRSIDPSVSFKKVVASRGKAIRAEPVAALFEQGRVHIHGTLPLLEDEMCAFGPNFDAKSAGFSPGRVDALVWAVTELCMNTKHQGVVAFYEQLAENRGVITPEMARPPAAARPKPAPPPALISMKSPRPHMNFAPATGVRYCSGDTGVFDVDPAHVDALINAGCWKPTDPGES
jgi:hypothetical protein